MITEYESKLDALTAQKNLLAHKMFYMEEHIVDLNMENKKQQTAMASMEALYRKKINTREDQIDMLKETIMELEESVAQYRLKENEWTKNRLAYQKEVDELKQMVSVFSVSFL